MKYNYFTYLIFILVFQGCQSQNSKSYHNDDFNWDIDFPIEYEILSNDEWSNKVEESGELIEESDDVEFENQSIPIFNFKNKSDYFESTKTKYEGSPEDYLNYLNDFFEIQTQTLKTQMPEMKINSKIDTLKISDLDFYHNYTIITYPNGAKRILESYNRLFENNYELSINIIYVNNEFGVKFKNALINSKFKK